MKNAYLVMVVLGGCQLEQPAPASTSSTTQAGMNMQGMNMQGMNMQGMNMQGMNMQGMNMQGASLAGIGLDNVRIDKGEVVADQNGVTLHGASLIGAHFIATAQDSASPPNTVQVEYRVTNVTPESSSYDPTHTGSTYLYTLEQHVTDNDTWVSACGADADGQSVAIPVAAIFDQHGDRSTSATMFTFGCTTGVIAKCYRWGYRPWVTGYGDLADMHWSCTRLARADYCGDGTPHTHDGTWVNVWDKLPAPGPIQSHGGLLPPLGMLFEAGWNHSGAVCLSRARWLIDDGIEIANECPDRLVPPGLGQTVCDTVAAVFGYDPNVKIFDESYINVNLGGVHLGL